MNCSTIASRAAGLRSTASRANNRCSLARRVRRQFSRPAVSWVVATAEITSTSRTESVRVVAARGPM
jgi:hypothetical protein